MKLITEVYNEDCEVITESDDSGNKKHFLEGIFMQGDVKNRNGRVYPSEILEKEMNRYNTDYITTKRALGELGHPEGPQINGDRVSHLITEMRKNGNDFYGKAKLLSTPMGEIVKTFVEEGVKVGVSTRGLGSVKSRKDGIMEVQNDFHLATVDIVTDPSGPGCFVQGIMENTEFYFDIATSSWRPSNDNPHPAAMQENTVSIERNDFNSVMNKLSNLEEEVRRLKKMNRTERKRTLDEGKAIELFSDYFDAISKKM